MTRKDYRKIARAFGEAGLTPYCGLTRVMVGIFKEDNPRFSPDKFNEEVEKHGRLEGRKDC